ncbi:MAG: hypothetical protein R3F60_15895 [bacterium]
MGEVQHAPIGGAHVELDVVLGTGAVVVHRSAQGGGGGGLEPLVHVDDVRGLRPKLGVGQAEDPRECHDPVVVVSLAVVLDQVGVAPALRVGAQVAQGRADHPVGLGTLAPLRGAVVRRRRVVDQLVLEQHPVTAGLELVVEEQVAEPRQLQRGGAGVGGPRRHQRGQVVELPEGSPARVITASMSSSRWPNRTPSLRSTETVS